MKAEHAVSGRKEDLKRHFLWVSDVQVAEDAEVSGGQGCDATSLDRQACVVLSMKVRILSHHLHQVQVRNRDISNITWLYFHTKTAS